MQGRGGREACLETPCQGSPVVYIAVVAALGADLWRGLQFDLTCAMGQVLTTQPWRDGRQGSGGATVQGIADVPQIVHFNSNGSTIILTPSVSNLTPSPPNSLKSGGEMKWPTSLSFC